MDIIDTILKQTMLFYSLEVGLILIVICFGINHVIKDKPNSEVIGALTCVLGVALILILLNSVVPFVLDYIHHDVNVVQGIYQNLNADNSISGSGGLGFCTVTITTAQNHLELTTVPLMEEVFLNGTYEVTAYYTSRSQMLIYVEMVE